MTYTPYPNNNVKAENPCIAYSDDGINWSEDGISNPIASAPESGYNSDSHIVMVGDTMECWWRQVDGSKYEIIKRKTSTDGINWSEEEIIFTTNTTNANSCLSPVVIYDDGKYKIWFVYQRSCLKYYESTDGTNWQYIRDIKINPTGSNYKIWHFDIIKTSLGYEFVGCYQLNSEFDKNNFIYYSTSKNNIGYKYPVRILTNGYDGRFDRLELYRPCLLKMNDDTDHVYYNLYYGAQGELKTWAIGLVQASDIESLKYYIEQESSYSDSYLESDSSGDSGEIEVTLTAISATYNGGEVTVGTALTSLTRITVTATYSDGSTATVTGYTLSGEIAEGENTITVSYSGKTATFTVTGVSESGGDDTTEYIVTDFESATWTVGYFGDSGEIETSANYHHSSYIAMPYDIGDYEYSYYNSDKYIRISYFDADLNYIDAELSGSKTSITLNGVENASYYVVNANTTDKTAVIETRKSVKLISDSFDDSKWEEKYFNDNGELVTEATLTMYHSSYMPIISGTVNFGSVTYGRISYFDADLNHLGWDRGLGIGISQSNVSPTSIDILTTMDNAVYYVINGNTVTKENITVTTW